MGDSRLSDRVVSLIRLLGGWVFLAMAGVVPLLVVPSTWVPNFDTDRAETLIIKLMVMHGLSCLLLLLGALMLLVSRVPALCDRRGLPLWALVVFWLWSLVPVMVSPIRAWSFYHWLTLGFPAAAAMTGMWFLASTGAVRRVLLTLLASGVVVCGIGVVSALGWRGFNMWAYGTDPRVQLETNPDQKRAPGGADRGAAMSTLGNPEYAGGFASVVAVVAAIGLFDWAPRSRRPWLVRVLALGVCGLALLQLVFTGSRQPWNVLLLTGSLRLFIALGTPPLMLAVGFCLSLLSVYTLGLGRGAVVVLLFLATPVLLAIRSGRLLALARSADRFNVACVLAGPAVIVLFLVAFSTAGPWNPNGLRLLQRFASATNASDNSMVERRLMYMTASEIVMGSPIVGVGPGRYSNLFSAGLTEAGLHDPSGVVSYYKGLLINKITDQAHNDYMQIAAELGVPGIVLFLTLMLVLLQRLYGIIMTGHGDRRLMAIAVFFALVAFLALMFTSFPLQTPDRAAVFWTLVACAIGLTVGDEDGPTEAGEAAA